MIKKHLVIMILCCLIPVAGLFALYLFQIPISPALWFGFMLLCPILHLVMMKYMMGGEHHEHQHHTAPMPQKPVETKVEVKE